MLFRVYVSRVFDGDPRGWAIEYSEILINDLKQPQPVKWIKVRDLPEIKPDPEKDDFRSLFTSQLVLIAVDVDSFAFIKRDEIDDVNKLCVPYVEIVKKYLGYILFQNARIALLHSCDCRENGVNIICIGHFLIGF